MGDDWIFSVDENASYLPRKDMIIISDISGQMLDTLTVLQWCETVTRVNVTPGSLESLITEPGQLEYTETFIASGEMNNVDFLFLRNFPQLGLRPLSSLPPSVFKGMQNLRILNLPESLEEVPFAMCQDCNELREVFPLPKTVKIIGDNAFSYCWSIETELPLHEGITYIGMCAFDGCYGLKGDLVLPSSLTTLEGHCNFRNCYNMGKVYIKIDKPLEVWGDEKFPNYNYLGVPIGSKELYEADEHYNKFMVIEEVDFDALGL